MRCEDIDRMLAEGTTTELDTEEARTHLSSCAECRALRQAEVPSPKLPDKLDATVRRIVHRDLRPLRPLPSNRVLVAALAALLAALVAGFSLHFGRSGWVALPAGSAAVLVVFTVLVAGLTLPSLVWSLVPASAFRWRPAAPLLFFAAGYPLAAAVLFPHEAARRFAGLPCLASGVAVALASSVVIFVLVRKGYAGSLPSTGALLGGSGALVGFVVLQLHCPILDAWHLSVWHGLIIAIPIAAGLAAGRLFARIR
ncbi:MAG: DUF1109 family protein [Bryobacterales bacterium]|nr:DUF1109 family protein [Bryobacterales bacterium]